MDARNEQEADELIDQIEEKTRDLGDEIKRRVLEKIIEECRERLDALPRPDNSLPEGGSGSQRPTPHR
jgi:hypothetical protein